MKQGLFITMLLLASFNKDGFAQKAKTKITYTHNFPPAMDAEVKKSYVEIFEKGRILYKINCARCHNTKVNGQELMPEFTKEHLAKYELRIQNPKHEEALSETRVTAEELQQIMIFLTYYKKVEESVK